MSKFEELKDFISGYDSVAVAFSGGCDSSLLLYVCKEVLGDKVTAVTECGPMVPKRDVEAAVDFCRKYGIRHIVRDMGSAGTETFKRNEPDRCYYCKKHMLEALHKEYPVVFEGTNLDDDDDFRPGARAVKETGTISPLRETGFTKNDVRSLSRELGLDTWNKPASACLASRIPYGERITGSRLHMIDEAEEILHDMGIGKCRVRVHGNMARIETENADREIVLENNERIYKEFKKLGFVYVTMDIAGYRTGSMNEVIKSTTHHPKG